MIVEGRRPLCWCAAATWHLSKACPRKKTAPILATPAALKSKEAEESERFDQATKKGRVTEEDCKTTEADAEGATAVAEVAT